MLKIAIVNDTAIAVEALYRAIAAAPGYHLLWIARTGSEAVRYCTNQPPDLILMDLNMPELDGVEATRQIMQRSPCAILIVTASITRNSDKVFNAMGYGALDVVATPALGAGDPQALRALLKKMAIAARLARESPAPKRTSPRDRSPAKRAQPPAYSSLQQSTQRSTQLPRLIAIGTSTGGPKALRQILSQLPSPFEAAIVVIQHIHSQFARGLVDWLNRYSTLPVVLAGNGDRPEVGKVMVAGATGHLILRPNQTLRYTREPADVPYQPSVDVFFQSVAQAWGQPGIALLLTGMGRDGASGMAQLQAAGWHTIAESAESCVVFGMPKAAIERGAATRVLPLNQLALHLVSALNLL